MRRWLLPRLLVHESRQPPIRGPLGANFSAATPRAAPRRRLIIAGGFRAAASRAGSRGLLELRGASRWRQKMARRRSSGEITGHASGGVSGAAGYRREFSGGGSRAAVVKLPEQSSWEALRGFRWRLLAGGRGYRRPTSPAISRGKDR
jgi:hypothetical protein